MPQTITLPDGQEAMFYPINSQRVGQPTVVQQASFIFLVFFKDFFSIFIITGIGVLGMT